MGVIPAHLLSPAVQTSANSITPETAAAKSLQSCPTLRDPIDGSPPCSPILGILRARVLEWVDIAFSEPPKVSFLN